MNFDGFEHLTANYLYCPNQFFDVCVPQYSRGTVRLVAYMLRKTLGWLDDQGHPVEQNISISYRDLITEAGISRGSIRKALDEAVAGRFITCMQEGKANGNHQSAETACYALRWDAEGQYKKAPDSFNGFYAGEGYRTPIPNSFFDSVVKQETLAVVKVVGTVLRHTVGYQNQFGGRRQIAPLSYSYIQQYAHLSDRSTLSAAIRHAIETGYIHCIQKGGINPSSKKRRASTYAIRWHEPANQQGNGTITRPVDEERYKKQTNNGSETRPAKRFKNQTEEKPLTNNTYKQHAPPAVAVENLGNTKSVQLLRQAGFDEVIARELSQKRGLDEIAQQIQWLPHRNPDRNSLEMLRRAIEVGWSKPDAMINTEKKQQRVQEHQKQATQAEIDEARDSRAKQEKKLRTEQLLPIWNGLSPEDQTQVEHNAFEQLNSNYFRERFRTNAEFRLKQCLDQMHRQENSTAQSQAEKEKKRASITPRS